MRYNLRPRKHTITYKNEIIKEKKYMNVWKKLVGYESPLQYPITSGTKIKNYFLNDCLLDLLHIKAKQTPLESSSSSEMNILCKKGLLFENKIFDHISRKVRMVTICDLKKYNNYDRKDTSKTLSCMLRGIPVIAQAPLYHKNSKTFGVADLLVRSDHIKYIIDDNPLDKLDQTYKASKLNGDYHYVVIDIKWSTMPLCSNGQTIRNSGRYGCYKGQLAIYNIALGDLQGYTPNKCYILGKGYSYSFTKNKKKIYCKSTNPFDRLGEIDYAKFDSKYINLTLNAIKWFERVNTHCEEMSYNPPSDIKLYPNMSNHYDNPYHSIKYDIANDIKELTLLWNVGVKNRNIAIKNGIDRWDDTRLTSKVLGISGKRGDIIDKIIEINQNQDKIIYPDKIIHNVSDWQNKEHSAEFYLDFETINECFIDREILINYIDDKSDIIYLIGLGYIKDNVWTYEYFLQDTYSLCNEKKIISKMFDRILSISGNSQPKIYHWGFAEKSMLKNANNRHNGIWSRLIKQLVYIDMYDIFVNEPIIVNGSLNFKLKNIALAMYNHNLIDSIWDSDIKSGISAMIDAIKLYNNDNGDFTDIIRYNEIDCKVLWEIMSYLRNNHI